MELPKGWSGSQKAIILAGIILSCVSHPGAAQKRVSVILEPPNPQAGQDVTLVVRGGPRQFTLCEWYREPRKGQPESIFEYISGPPRQQRNGTAHSGRETARADCSMHITRLRPSDTGNYSVIFEGTPTRQDSEQRPGQDPDEFYEGSVYLEVSAPEQITIAVQSVPQQPSQGQEVTLTPQRTPHEMVFCEWFKEGSSEDVQSVIQYRPGEQQSPQGDGAGSHARVTVGPDCSLRMARLTTADSGIYTVKMQGLPDQQQEQPGQGTRPQDPRRTQEFWGQIELQVNKASIIDQQKGKSAGLSYSAGIVAGALLVFFAWTDTFTSLSHVLCSSSSQPGHLQ